MSVTKSSRAAEVHAATVRSEIGSLVESLSEALTRSLVAYIVGVADTKTVERWEKEERKPKLATERRLRDIFQIFQLLNSAEDVNTVRAWFIGMNPQLDDESPATALREGRVRDVKLAAEAFISGG